MTVASNVPHNSDSSRSGAILTTEGLGAVHRDSHHKIGHLGASVQSWRTPRWLFDQLNAEFDFFLDVAASRENALCQYFYVEEEDALTQPWAPYACYANPPYRRLYPWVQKAYDESRQGATVVMLLPSSTGSRWFQEIVQPHAEVRFLRGRLRFEGAKHPATFDSMVVVFRPPANAGRIDMTRPPVRYFGGKWRIAPWIIAHFLSHACYVEPFGGGASVLLRKPPAPFEVLNDRDDEIVNVFRVLRDQPEALRRTLELTPWSRTELYCAYLPTDDPLERARRYIVRSMQGWFGGTREKPQGWRFQKQQHRNKSTTASWDDWDHLLAAAQRLRSVQIECDDAFAVIERFDTPKTLHYIDPPYPRSTRGARWGKDGYRYELSDDDHRRLAALLHSLDGMVVISSYRSDLYSELYGDWQRRDRLTVDGTAKQVTESLWISPNAAANHQQRSLFAWPAEEAAG